MADYDPTADNKLEVEKPRTAIQAWSLNIVWDNGEEETITDIPNYAAREMDQFLDELEEEARAELDDSDEEDSDE
jgi:hypothetical protein